MVEPRQLSLRLGCRAEGSQVEDSQVEDSQAEAPPVVGQVNRVDSPVNRVDSPDSPDSQASSLVSPASSPDSPANQALSLHLPASPDSPDSRENSLLDPRRSQESGFRTGVSRRTDPVQRLLQRSRGKSPDRLPTVRPDRGKSQRRHQNRVSRDTSVLWKPRQRDRTACGTRSGRILRRP